MKGERGDGTNQGPSSNLKVLGAKKKIVLQGPTGEGKKRIDAQGGAMAKKGGEMK